MGCRPDTQNVTAQGAVSLVSLRARQVSIGLPWSVKVTVPVGAGAPGVPAGAATVADMVVRWPARICLATRSATDVWVVQATGAECGLAPNAMAAPRAPASAVARKKR